MRQVFLCSLLLALCSFSIALKSSRLLQVENPNNPTGKNMGTNIDYPAKTDTLTISQVNWVANSQGLNSSGNSQLDDSSSNKKPSPSNPAASNSSQTNGSSTSSSTSSSTYFVQTPWNGENTPLTQTDSSPSSKLSQAPDAQFYKEQLDQILNTTQFQLAHQALLAQTNAYTSVEQLVAVDSIKDSGNVLYRFTVYRSDQKSLKFNQYRILVPASGSARVAVVSNFSAVSSIPSEPYSKAVDTAERISRSTFSEFLNRNQSITINQYDLWKELPRSTGLTVFQFTYTNKTTNDSFEVVSKAYIYSDSVSVEVISFKYTGTATLRRPTLFRWASTLMESSDHNIQNDGVLKRFVYQTFGSVYQKMFQRIKSAISFSLLNNKAEKLLYFANYKIDNQYYDIVASINLITKTKTIQYFKPLGATNATLMNSSNSADGFSDLHYLNVFTDNLYNTINKLARTTYKSQLETAPVTKIETKLVDLGQIYRITYILKNASTVYITSSPVKNSGWGINY